MTRAYADVVNASLRICYADPPYPGNAHRYPEKKEVDHVALITQLETFDGWALSTGSTNLAAILPLCPPKVRIGAWVKRRAFFKPHVNPAYAWEPVLFKPARKFYNKKEPTDYDWVMGNATQETGIVGAKPIEFCFWIFRILGALPEDEFMDMFPGSGIVGKTWKAYCAMRPLPL